jgi:DNA invertase Pin-like site-specific DNA recombinase
MKNTPAVAYSYIRFSSPTQRKGESVKRQEKERDEWVNRSGVILDTTLNMRDEGVSAFTGEHRKNPDRNALAGFLELVRQSKIPKGSFLIVENLDRLSREHIQPALLLFLNLLQAGIKIVQLLPSATVFDDKSEAMSIMLAVAELSRGHSESMMKSIRMKDVWQTKRKRATASGTVISRSCPAWIRVVQTGDNQRYELIPERAEVVRRIFRLAVGGSGVRAIVKTLHAEKIPTFTGKPWNRSYVAVIIKNRSAYGQFTPRTGRGSSAKRKPDGPPIDGYYPAVVTDAEWYAAQQAMENRIGKAGRPGKRIVNVFNGMIFDARTGKPLHVMHYARVNGQKAPSLAPYEAAEHGTAYVSFPLDIFEQAVFSKLREIDPLDILPADDGTTDNTLSLSGREASIKAQLTKIRSHIRSGEELDTLIQAARELESELKDVDEQLDKARRESSSPRTEAWGQCKTIIDTLDSAPDRDVARMNLRKILQRTVESVHCLFQPGRGDRLAAAQFRFQGGEHRDYIIMYRPLHVSKTGKARPAKWWVESFATAGIADSIDLRRTKDVKKLETALGKLDLSGKA